MKQFVSFFKPNGSELYLLSNNRLFSISLQDFSLQSSRYIKKMSSVTHFCVSKKLGLLFFYGCPEIEEKLDDDMVIIKKGNLHRYNLLAEEMINDSFKKGPNGVLSKIKKQERNEETQFFKDVQNIENGLFSIEKKQKELKPDCCNIIMNGNYIVKVFEHYIKLYHCFNINRSVRKFKTGENEEGCCAMSSDFCVLAYPDQQIGSLTVVKIHIDQTIWKTTITKAFETKITQLKLSKSGILVAAASKKGKLIKIFDSNTGKKVSELRRGTTNRMIVDMCFSRDNSHFAVLSETGTLHIFKLNEKEKKGKLFNKIFAVNNRGFGKYRGIEEPYKCCFKKVKDYSICVVVITKKGNIFELKFDKKKGESPTTATKRHVDDFVSKNYSYSQSNDSKYRNEIVSSTPNSEEPKIQYHQYIVDCVRRNEEIEQIKEQKIEFNPESKENVYWLIDVLKKKLNFEKDLFLYIKENNTFLDPSIAIMKLFKENQTKITKEELKIKDVLTIYYDFKPDEYCEITYQELPFMISRHSLLQIPTTKEEKKEENKEKEEKKCVIFGGMYISKAKFKHEEKMYELKFKENEKEDGKIIEINTIENAKMKLPLHSHSSFYDSKNEEIYVFGGAHEIEFSSTMYCYNLKKKEWRIVKTKGSIPTKRIDASIVFKEKERKAILFGGFTKSMQSQKGEYCDNLYQFDLETLEWTIIIPISKFIPIGRAKHYLKLYNNDKDVLLVSGIYDQTPCFDTWSFNFTNRRWRRISVFSPANIIACYVLKDNYLVSVPNDLSKIFIFNIIKKTWRNIPILQKESKFNIKRNETSFSSVSSIMDKKCNRIYIVGGESINRKSTNTVAKIEFSDVEKVFSVI